MKKTVLVLFSIIGVATALAATGQDSADAGIYGRLDLMKFPKPKVINAKPIVVDATVKQTSVKPIYLHVPLGHERHWRSLCGSYDACAMPVYFVTEKWFLNVYLPAVGSQDGREQRYRIETSRERSDERNIHDVHGED